MCFSILRELREFPLCKKEFFSVEPLKLGLEKNVSKRLKTLLTDNNPLKMFFYEGEWLQLFSDR